MFPRLVITLITLSQTICLVNAAWASDACVKSCSDWSIVLGHCRGQFEPAPHQTNITYASQFIQCLCDGSKENANEMMGSGAMKEAAYTCSECVTTPAVIVEDLNTFMGICVIIAENGTAAQATTWAPFGYSLVTFGENGRAKQVAPEGALI